MKKIILFFMFLSLNLFSENLSSVKTIFLKTGISKPVFSHWGDRDIGFKMSPQISFMGIKDIDENLSYGFQIGYDFKHKNNNNDLSVKIFSLNPQIFSWLGLNEKKYYVYLGPGIYHWTQEKTPAFDSSSDTTFGFNMGAGFVKPIKESYFWGLNLEWVHLIDMNNNNINLNSINNILINLTLIKKI